MFPDNMFYLQGNLRQSWPENDNFKITFTAYSPDIQLCVVQTLALFYKEPNIFVLLNCLQVLSSHMVVLVKQLRIARWFLNCTGHKLTQPQRVIVCRGSLTFQPCQFVNKYIFQFIYLFLHHFIVRPFCVRHFDQKASKSPQKTEVTCPLLVLKFFED